MLINGLKVRPNSEFQYDLCIIGAGAAGITIARSFIGSQTSVCLLESGGFGRSKKYTDLYAGETVGVKKQYLTRTRLRMFGGTTNHWGGYCRPLDEFDFEKHTWIPESIGWPFERSEIVPYYERAASVVEIDPFFSTGHDHKEFFGKDCNLEISPFHFSRPPTNFRKRYRKQLVNSENIVVCLHSNARELIPNRDKNACQSLVVKNGNGISFTVKAKVFVLATGAIENPRILLNSNRIINEGIGNRFDLVGRYFMSHSPINGIASLLLSGPHTNEIADKIFRPSYSYISIKGKSKRQKNLQNLGFALYKVRPEEKFEKLTNFAQIKVAFDQNYGIQNKFKLFNLVGIAEQSPNWNSRISLIDEEDFTGMRRLKLNYQRLDRDRSSVKKSIQYLASELGRCGLGRVRIEYHDDPDFYLKPDDHHMGTTRMHVDPKLGVVDSNCMVHGFGNLYVAGGSVFPSSGFANPTFTIVALALRLADHIKGELE